MVLSNRTWGHLVVEGFGSKDGGAWREESALVDKSRNVARKSYCCTVGHRLCHSFLFAAWWVVFVALRVGVIDVSHFSSILSTNPWISNLCSTCFGRASRAWCRLAPDKGETSERESSGCEM